MRKGRKTKMARGCNRNANLKKAITAFENCYYGDPARRQVREDLTAAAKIAGKKVVDVVMMMQVGGNELDW